MYEPNELNREQRGALNRVRDQYAAMEVLAGLLIEGVGDMTHMRDGAARLINYSYPLVTSAGFAASDEDTAEALNHFGTGLASLKRAHLIDAHIMTEQGIEVGRPRVNTLRNLLLHALEQIADKEKFGR